MDKKLNKLIKDLDKLLADFGPEIPLDVSIDIHADCDGISFHVTGEDLDEWAISLKESYKIAIEHENYLNDQGAIK
jgi:hypothetical protein